MSERFNNGTTMALASGTQPGDQSRIPVPSDQSHQAVIDLDVMFFFSLENLYPTPFKASDQNQYKILATLQNQLFQKTRHPSILPASNLGQAAYPHQRSQPQDQQGWS